MTILASPFACQCRCQPQSRLDSSRSTWLVLNTAPEGDGGLVSQKVKPSIAVSPRAFSLGLLETFGIVRIVIVITTVIRHLQSISRHCDRRRGLQRCCTAMEARGGASASVQQLQKATVSAVRARRSARRQRKAERAQERRRSKRGSRSKRGARKIPQKLTATSLRTFLQNTCRALQSCNVWRKRQIRSSGCRLQPLCINAP